MRHPIRNAIVTILKIIEEYLTYARDYYISLGKTKLEFKENFMKMLERLFDVLDCKGDIILFNNVVLWAIPLSSIISIRPMLPAIITASFLVLDADYCMTWNKRHLYLLFRISKSL